MKELVHYSAIGGTSDPSHLKTQTKRKCTCSLLLASCSIHLHASSITNKASMNYLLSSFGPGPVVQVQVLYLSQMPFICHALILLLFFTQVHIEKVSFLLCSSQSKKLPCQAICGLSRSPLKICTKNSKLELYSFSFYLQLDLDEKSALPLHRELIFPFRS